VSWSGIAGVNSAKLERGENSDVATITRIEELDEAWRAILNLAKSIIQEE
jgi:hypothetical protein